jgi:16S rRNA (guanine966-N2)-methyltransferase
LTCTVNPHLRPAPERVREALFNILGDAVPGRVFYDLFAGTGAIGLEALSRGARRVLFVERDFRVAGEIDRHLQQFQVVEQGSVVRADVYRWVDRWPGNGEPVNVFLGPPYVDFERRPEELLAVAAALQAKIAPGSVLVIQLDDAGFLDHLPEAAQWEVRRYGRNYLLIWVRKHDEPVPTAAAETT